MGISKDRMLSTASLAGYEDEQDLVLQIRRYRGKEK